MWSQSHPPPTCKPPIEAQAAPGLGQGRIGEGTEPRSPASAPGPPGKRLRTLPSRPLIKMLPPISSSEAKDTLWLLLSPILQVNPEPVASQRQQRVRVGPGLKASTSHTEPRGHPQERSLIPPSPLKPGPCDLGLASVLWGGVRAAKIQERGWLQLNGAVIITHTSV